MVKGFQQREKKKCIAAKVRRGTYRWKFLTCAFVSTGSSTALAKAGRVVFPLCHASSNFSLSYEQRQNTIQISIASVCSITHCVYAQKSRRTLKIKDAQIYCIASLNLSVLSYSANTHADDQSNEPLHQANTEANTIDSIIQQLYTCDKLLTAPPFTKARCIGGCHTWSAGTWEPHTPTFHVPKVALFICSFTLKLQKCPVLRRFVLSGHPEKQNPINYTATFNLRRKIFFSEIQNYEASGIFEPVFPFFLISHIFFIFFYVLLVKPITGFIQATETKQAWLCSTLSKGL